MNDTQLQIDITLLVNPGFQNSFSILLKDESDRQVVVKTTFVERRTQPFQTVIGADLNTTIRNLKQSMELDYRDILTSSVVSNSTLRINFLLPNWRYISLIRIPESLPIKVNPELIPSVYFNIKSVEFLPSATDRCNKIKVKVTTTAPMTSYCINRSCNMVDSNILEFEYTRGSSFELDVVRQSNRISRNINTPPLLQGTFGNIKISIINGLNGGTAIIDAPNTNELEHQFSLDNINWQNNNTFSGLLEGYYTAYIKDKFGCSTQKEFKIEPYVNNVVQSDNFHYVSKSNSIRFAQRVDFNIIHKTDENTLSCEADVIKPYTQIQLFKKNDIIKTQFKSNFKSNRVFVVYENIENFIPVQRQTNNTGIKDKRTAYKYNLGNGKTGIYFLNGVFFDYDTGAVLGSYELNGFLPEWAKKGNRFTMDDVWFEIIDTLYDENKSVDVIVINNIYTGNDADIMVSAMYNRENYEVYEFSIDMNDYLNKKIRVKIEMTPGIQTPINLKKTVYLSEEIYVCDKCDNTVEIRYKNTKNTDVVYSTGIEHLLRIPYDLVSGKDINTSDNHKTDDKVILLDADIYESNTFKFEPLTKELWRKLKIALSHDTIFIDGVGYVKDEDFETEGPLGHTNLYILTATMAKTGANYSNKQSNDIIIINPGNVTIPEVIGLIGNGTTTGFIQQ